MNIMEIVSGAEVNGAVIHCLLLTRSLARRGHQVTLLCRENAFIAGQLCQDNVEIITSDMHRLPFDELRRIAGLCRERRVDVLHTHMTRAHNFGVCLRRLSHIPCVATAHSHIIQPHWMFNDHVVAVSDATRRFQRRRNLVREKRIETIYGFMDYPRFAGVSCEAAAQIRQEWGLDAQTPLLGIIGDIIPRKGQLHLIRALPLILASCPDVHLAIIGEPKRGVEYFHKVRAEAERLGVNDHILWVGHRNDVPHILSALDVYVLASLDEMFPVAVLEAMAAGRAIVATRVGGVPECVQNRETALLVPPEDPDALAQAILALLTNPQMRRQLGDQAREVAHSQFSVESQTPRIEAVFERVIHRSGAPGAVPEH
jgi:glycosyltransferase involved in cell wall biosynthesis